jgi:signal transduction histidine kinase
MRERVRDQGGTLDIQSEATGVTVVVTLPLAADAVTQTQNALPSALIT